MLHKEYFMRHVSTILIVDDDKGGRDVLEAMLIGRGYNLVFAENGLEALKKAEEINIDLVLLDVMMPVMDGFEVCRSLRANPFFAEVPIILVTALDDRDSRLKGIEAGADDFVTKPFDHVELRARVQTITRLNRYRQKLRESEKMASLGCLIAGAAHELNNPINFIYSNIPHLREYIRDIKVILEKCHDMSKLPLNKVQELIEYIEEYKEEIDLEYVLEDLERLVDDIHEGARRTKDIVENLKSVCQSGGNGSEKVDIVEYIEESLKNISYFHENQINIHRNYSDLPKVRVYASQLNQVFTNLIVNAYQAINGEGDIWITTRLEENDTVLISIKDNGVGMTRENMNKIFDPFFTTKEVGRGLGLGLSIAYGIIQRHRGEILVDSELGLGTTFNIRIPVDFEKLPQASGI
jgi:signal transduction histidine kinase